MPISRNPGEAPETRSLLASVRPKLTAEQLEWKLAQVNRDLRVIQEFCDEHEIDMPDVTIQVDTSCNTIDVIHQTPADHLRFQQILFRMKKEYDHFNKENP